MKHKNVDGLAAAYLSEQALWQGNIVAAGILASQAVHVATRTGYEADMIHASLLACQAAIASKDLNSSDRRLHRALARARAINLVDVELCVLIAIADLDFRRERYVDAKARLDDVWEGVAFGPYPLYQADAFNVLADVARAEGDREGAIEAATKAYRAAWCDGPPWAYHWGLEKAKALLREFGAPEPDMPPFDESKFDPMPEVEINPKDEYWVDPATLD